MSPWLITPIANGFKCVRARSARHVVPNVEAHPVQANVLAVHELVLAVRILRNRAVVLVGSALGLVLFHLLLEGPQLVVLEDANRHLKRHARWLCPFKLGARLRPLQSRGAVAIPFSRGAPLEVRYEGVEAHGAPLQQRWQQS